MGLSRLLPAAALVCALLFAGCSGLIDRSLQRKPLEVAQVTSGQAHTCALTPAGEAYCWGLNRTGQVGTLRTGLAFQLPTPVEEGAYASIEAGDFHTCGVVLDGGAVCWGSNASGQIGTRTKFPVSLTPVAVDFPDRAVAVTAGSHHSCLLDQSGRAHCWGLNNIGELGHPADSAVLLPTPVETGLRFTKITAGWEHTCGLAEDRSAHCWGSNTFGQLGDGSIEPTHVPTAVIAPPLKDLSAGTVHTCGLALDGTAICWGALASLALGRAADDACLRHACAIPGPVEGDNRFAQITAGDLHTCGTTPEGQVFCWGTGNAGAIGNCEITPEWPSPELVCGGHTFAGISAGALHTCGFTPEGQGWCWGANDDFQLGSSFFSSFGPRPIASPLP